MKKKFNGIKKFFVNRGVIFAMTIILFIASAIYFVCYTDSQNIIIQASVSEYNKSEYKQLMIKKSYLDTACNATLAVISIAASSLLTSVFIEKRDKNNLINDVVVHDFLTSEYFVNKLDDDEFNNLLVSLEKKKYFTGNKMKAYMYAAIRKKLNTAPLDDKPLYYEKCTYDIKCRDYDDYIEKEFLKSIEVKCIDRCFKEKQFILLSVTNCPIDGLETSEIKSFKIDKKPIDLNLIKKAPFKVSSMSIKQGYSQGFNYCYDGIIDFSGTHKITIDVEYITRTPKDDATYTVRLPYPCKSFNFKFSLDSKNYNINPIAFGFIDDAKDSPNRSNDRKNVTINFEDWIFPLDGVCVILEKNACKKE